MGFIKLSFVFLFILSFSSKASPSKEEPFLTEESWELKGAFFLKQKCFISVRDIKKDDEGIMQNATMMTLNCSKYIRRTHRYNPRGSSRQLRAFACHNFSFCNRWYAYGELFQDEFYEVDLLKDSYLRSIVILTLREPLREEGGLRTSFYRGIVLDLLEEKTP